MRHRDDAGRLDALHAYLDSLRPRSRLALDRGTGTVEWPCASALFSPDKADETSREAAPCAGRALLPPEGVCLLLLWRDDETFLSRNFGGPLRLAGTDTDGAWVLEADQLYARVVSEPFTRPSWALAVPVNGPLRISHGEPHRVARVAALINNLDLPGRQRPLTVQAGTVAVQFSPAPTDPVLRDLHAARVLRTASLATFEFQAWPGAAEEELVAFCDNVSTLCTYATGTHNGVPLVTLSTAAGRVVRQIVRSPIEGPRPTTDLLIDGQALGDFEALFRQGFEEHVRMRRSPLPWRKLASYCGAIEDGAFLEQKFSNLMMAVEFFIRTCLLEADPVNAPRFSSMKLTDLLGTAQAKLGWAIPGHYGKKDLVRLLRNAVAHGGELPTRDSAEFRSMFDKWRLFLFRRVLIRLGYTGRVLSPRNGWQSASAVDDFSEEHNSF